MELDETLLTARFEEPRLKDKIAFVKGSGPLALAACRMLCEAGTLVYIADYKKDRASKVAKELYAEGLQIKAAHIGMNEIDSVTMAVEHIADEIGTIDFFVNMAVNGGNAALVSHAVLSYMRPKKGHIVNIFTIAVSPDDEEPQRGHLALSHALQAEARKHAVKTTVLTLGSANSGPDAVSAAHALKFILIQPDGTFISELALESPS